MKRWLFLASVSVLVCSGLILFEAQAPSGRAHSNHVIPALPGGGPKELGSGNENDSQTGSTAALQRALQQNAKEIKALVERNTEEIEQEERQKERLQNKIDELQLTSLAAEEQIKKQDSSPTQELERLQKQIDQQRQQNEQMREQMEAMQRTSQMLTEQLKKQATSAADLERLQKQNELQQKQIEVLQQTSELLGEQIKKQAPAAPIEKMELQTAQLASRSQQAAQRDKELATATNELIEKVDAQQRNGPVLPAPLKELFLLSGTNETPLSIYFNTASSYHNFTSSKGAGQFMFEEFSPFFLLQLNNRFLIEAETVFALEKVELGQGQVDMIVNDWLTIVGGRFLAPIGFFNERLHPQWINKLPDVPLMMRQGSLANGELGLSGLQFRGGKYLFGSPVKVEYSAYATNGFGVPGEGKLNDFANIEALADTTRGVNNAMAYGGRLGLWLPARGLNGGVSAIFNRPFSADGGSKINLWQLDTSYHHGNWDLRFEYAQTLQETAAFIGNDIDRRGLYAQVAYRPYKALNRCLSNLETVFRYSYTNFHGIDPAKLDLEAFESPINLPVNRNQYTIGLNYYFYPSAILKFAYEFNQETSMPLKDNLFMAQFGLGF